VEPRTHPTAGIDAADAPLGVPLAAPAEGGEHVFVSRQDDGVRPVAYDPCRPIHYVLRPDGAPAGGEAVVADAIARISGVTGLPFVYDGPTDEAPTTDRAVYQPDRYGDRWAPVLISWQTEAENPALAGVVAGLGGSSWAAAAGGTKVYVTGNVALDAADLGPLLAGGTGPSGPAVARAVVLHELGHLLGLQHVADPKQLMYPTTQPDVLDFAAGDLTGLAELGAGECVPEL
jgi:hypothetical protein